MHVVRPAWISEIGIGITAVPDGNVKLVVQLYLQCITLASASCGSITILNTDDKRFSSVL
jgi:hypothetical protein